MGWLVGDAAENFVQPSRLEVQFLELEPSGHRELRNGWKNCGTLTRQCREPPLALADFNFRHRGQGCYGGACRGELVWLFQLQRDGVVVTRFEREPGRGVVGN